MVVVIKTQQMLAILVMLMAIALVLLITSQALENRSANDETIRYFSDPSVMMVFPQAIERFTKNDEITEASATVFLGNNLHVWWFELPLHEFNPAHSDRYLMIKNPAVGNLVAYIPQKSGEYLPMLGGWRNIETNDMEFFNSPTFWLDDAVDWTRPAYIRIRSPYSHHYEFKLLSRAEFNYYNIYTLQITSVFLGSLLFLVLFQLISYWRLRQPAFLVFTMFLMSVISYQMIQLGLVKVLFGGVFIRFAGMGIQAAFIMTVFSILFTLSFFKPVLQKRNHRLLAVALMLLAIPGLLCLGIRCPHKASTYACIYALTVGVTVLGIAWYMLCKGYQHALNFFIGWSFLFFSAVITVLMMHGYVSNNLFNVNVIWIAVAAQSIVFNLALFDRFQNLKTAAKNDVLTGAGNRYAGTSHLAEAFLNYQLGMASPAVIFFDLDQFKAVNDTYGHAAGDEVLIRVVDVVKSQVRESDQIFRWGGDEFVLVCYGLSSVNADEICNNINNAVKKLTFTAGERQFGAFISIGVAWFELNDGSFADALKRADTRLYEAKKQNRQRYGEEVSI